MKPRTPLVATNYLFLSAAEFVAKIAATVAFAYLARVLGPEGYGYLEFVLAILFFFTLLVDSGLSTFGAREIAKDPSLAGHLIVNITFTRILLAVVAFLLLLLISTILDKPQDISKLLILYGITLFGLPWLMQWVFQGHDKMHVVALASIIRWVTFTGAVFIFVHGEHDLWLVPFAEVAAILFAAGFLLRNVSALPGKSRGQFNFRYACKTYKKAYLIGASELVWAAKIYSATVILGVTASGSDVGWYSAAHRIVIALHTFVWLYFYNLLPSISRTTNESIDSLRRMTHTSLQVTAWFAVFLGILGTAFAGPGMTLLYGAQYQNSIAAFQVMIWLIPVTLISGHYRYILIAYDKQHLELLSALGGAAVNILLNLALIPSMGLMGAAWALVSSEIVILGIAYYYVRRDITHISALGHFGRPLVAGVILVVVLIVVMPINLWAAGVLGVVVYPLVLALVQPELVNRFRAMIARNERNQ